MTDERRLGTILGERIVFKAFRDIFFKEPELDDNSFLELKK